jgi:hypothetical protein
MLSKGSFHKIVFSVFLFLTHTTFYPDNKWAPVKWHLGVVLRAPMLPIR